ncbi:IS110 family transposase [Nonomuraea sp. FMUSA5-5]|uniref:IS110 family transposase n=1 Tax=Nonomuraea composti TaxID=2720023 RepID=A0ABX1BIX2_9ACTN|nr:IS110 family transposase [Nonomuraea sp. FMUSA5-5]NJP96442.1 IS110 family transposase [Nonomuraea sp. FMUSA5-5]
MEVVHPAVAGIDVHKKILWVAIRLPGEHRPFIRSYRTFWRALQKMAAELVELGVTDVAMESTGVYWWPVYHALAQTGRIELCVANAEHLKSVPGRKTDIRDCQWIAELHQFGLLRPSFIPAQNVAALRHRTRYRKKLIEVRTSEGQRLAKVLEDAGIKIDSVTSKLLCLSGRDMIEALIAGERDPHVLAGLARGVLRHKHEDLVAACDGRFTDTHAAMCRLHLDAYDHTTGKITELDGLVAEAATVFEPVITRLMTIVGIGRRTAEVIVAETGADMSRFPAPEQLAAWAGLAPATGSQRVNAGEPPPVRATNTSKPPWSKPPGAPPAPDPGSEPGCAAWYAASASSTPRRPRSPPPTRCYASAGWSWLEARTTAKTVATSTTGAKPARPTIWPPATKRLWNVSATRSP